MRIASVVIALCVMAGSAGAQPEGLRAGGGLDLELTYDRTEIVDAGAYQVDLWAMVGKQFPLLYAVGLDMRLGGSDPGGFLYELDLRLIGFGLLLGKSAQLVVTGGGGVGGRPFRWQLPAEARLEFDLGPRIRITALGRTALTTDDNTYTGAVTVRLGKRYYGGHRGLSAGNGYFLGAGVTRDGYQVLLGYSINVSWNR